MIRPQPLLAPRPNVRRHPLDDWERAMIEQPDLETDAHPSGRDMAMCTVLVLLIVAVVGWGLWKIAEWILGGGS